MVVKGDVRIVQIIRIIIQKRGKMRHIDDWTCFWDDCAIFLFYIIVNLYTKENGRILGTTRNSYSADVILVGAASSLHPLLLH